LAGKKKGRELAVGREEESAELRVLSAELRKKLAVGSGQERGVVSFWEEKAGGGWFIIFR